MTTQPQPAYPWASFDGPEEKPPLIRNAIGGIIQDCRPGEPKDPSRWCTRHSDHHYCETCKGWYGVPHDGIHGGTSGWERTHPLEAPFGIGQCACRPCRTYAAMSTSEIEAAFAAADSADGDA